MRSIHLEVATLIVLGALTMLSVLVLPWVFTFIGYIFVLANLRRMRNYVLRLFARRHYTTTRAVVISYEGR